VNQVLGPVAVMRGLNSRQYGSRSEMRSHYTARTNVIARRKAPKQSRPVERNYLIRELTAARYIMKDWLRIKLSFMNLFRVRKKKLI
jgi:hypothetical protein